MLKKLEVCTSHKINWSKISLRQLIRLKTWLSKCLRTKVHFYMTTPDRISSIEMDAPTIDDFTNLTPEAIFTLENI